MNDNSKQNITNNQVEVITPVIETTKKDVSNKLYFILIIVLLLLAFAIDKIFVLFSDDNYEYYNGTSIKETSSELTNGYIKLGNKTNYMIEGNIKFYNFRYSNNGIILNYLSYTNRLRDDIYIELYNTKEQLVYREIFNPETIEINAVTEYKIKCSNIYYAKVIIYSDEELNSTTSLECKYKDDNYEYVYTYSFVNSGLNYYEINKTSLNNDETLLNESDSLDKLGINTVYNKDNNSLYYKIDYSVKTDYLYDKNTLYYNVLNNETNKKWECD